VFNQDFWSRAGDVRHPVVLGKPEALVAKALAEPREINRIAQRLSWAGAFTDGHKVENGKRSHGDSVHSRPP
jgi:hypothetical protein